MPGLNLSARWKLLPVEGGLFRLVFCLALIVPGGPALGQTADQAQGVTILRGSSAPPPPPSPSAPMTVIEREVVHVPAYPAYSAPSYVIIQPRGSARHVQPAPPPPVADGWPLLRGGHRR
jgi:hypothetical protein